MSAQQALPLPSPATSNTVVINARCSLRIEADQRAIIVAGLPMHHYCADDPVAKAHAMVMLVDAGFAQQTEVARALADRCAPCAGTKGGSRKVGWRRSAETRVGVTVDAGSPESVCALSRS
jgi:hypothetical protein